ncbi:MAG TPA: MarR family transcriptional regulator [Gaiellaceae bacterium]|nr:MarR family transcriptional regulator [Gaiellaceae bacterium]
MSTPVLPREQQLEAWVRFLRAHAALTRELSADLVAGHGLTINDYEVLLHLARAPDNRLRRVDLAERVLLTASGITRLLDGLERAGYVERESCSTDRRVVYAKITEAGVEKLREAGRTHLAGIRELFTGRFDESELQTLATLLGRLPGASADGDVECTGEDE